MTAHGGARPRGTAPAPFRPGGRGGRRRARGAAALVGRLLVALSGVVPVLSALTGAAGVAQTPDSVLLTGRVTTPAGSPVSGAHVYLEGRVEGAVTGDQGRFSFATTVTGEATLIVKALGYSSAQRVIAVPPPGPISVEVSEHALSVSSLSVTASGRDPVEQGRTVSLTSVDVVTTTGSGGDLLKALQTFPGVQTMDGGARLFVRGGAPFETRVLANGARLLSPFRFSSPRSASASIFPSSLAQDIDFSSGGFGARHGDALSGLVTVETQGDPGVDNAGAGLSLGRASGNVHYALSSDLSLHASAARSESELLLALNGEGDSFAEAPTSHSLSGSLVWTPGDGHQVKLFGFDQGSEFAARLDDGRTRGTFAAETTDDVVVLSDRAEISETLRSRVRLSRSTSHRTREFDVLRGDEARKVFETRAEISWIPTDRLKVTTGANREWEEVKVGSRFPSRRLAIQADSSTLGADAEVQGIRTGAFAQFTVRPLGGVELTAGARSDHSSLTGDWTVDPRVSASYHLSRRLRLKGSWGRYHQIPSPEFFVPPLGTAGLNSMVSEQWIGGVEYGREGKGVLLRLEGYRKVYENLVEGTASGEVHAGGVGETVGLDLFARGDGPFGVRGHVTYSLVDAERTDPDTEELARSPFDVTHSLAVVANRPFEMLGGMFVAGASFRHATGRPFTPVTDARFDRESMTWIPDFGEPFSSRLPAFSETNLQVMYVKDLIGQGPTVFYVSANNVLGHENVTSFTYDEDFSDLILREGAFSRTVFFGVSSTLTF